MAGPKWHNKKEILGMWVLSMLLTKKLHGYELLQRINEDPFLGPINPGMIYRILRELEMLGFVVSQWSFGGGPAKRIYAITPIGKKWLYSMKPYLEEHKRFIDSVLEKLK